MSVCMSVSVSLTTDGPRSDSFVKIVYRGLKKRYEVVCFLFIFPSLGVSRPTGWEPQQHILRLQ